MKAHLLPELLTIAAVLLLGSPRRVEAQAAAVPAAAEVQPEAASKTAVLAGWGKAIDPDGDCKFFLSEGALLINVPGSASAHDLSPEMEKTNAPRVLQPVNGDFSIQVHVDGRFTPGEDSTLDGRTGYNGAGIVAIMDPKNLVTLVRAVLKREGEEDQPYANFELRKDGELQRIGLTGDHPLPKN